MLKMYNTRLFDAFLTIQRAFSTSKNTKSANLSLQLLSAQVSTFCYFRAFEGVLERLFYVSDKRLGGTETEVEIEADRDVSRVVGDVEFHYLLVLLIVLLLV